ncbi:MAG: hypothetical protein ABSH27_04530 [Solirubrobacteraceae bacterium]
MSVEMNDGSVHTKRADSGLAERGERVARVAFDVADRELELVLADGSAVTIEVGSPGVGDAPSPGRLVVYLDQLHWITLARQIHAPDKVHETERAAADLIIQLARERKVILPLSSAHLTETAQTDGAWRTHLATVMLDFSRGWQMRNPVGVRHRELRAALEGNSPVAAEVFTLEPHVIFASGLSRVTSADSFPAVWQELIARLTAVTAIYDVMLMDDRVSIDEGLTIAARWASSHHELAVYLRDEHAGRERTRVAAHGRLLIDLCDEIAFAAAHTGLEPAALGQWLTEAPVDGLAAMPYLGRLEQVIFHRLRNADDTWDANDLNDLNFLACAAGYADVVVGEKKTTEYLLRAETTLGRRAATCRTLARAVEHLRTLGIDG